MLFQEAMFLSHSGNLWLGFGAQGAHWLTVKVCQWDSQKGFLSLCMMFTLILSVFQTVGWILPVDSSVH